MARDYERIETEDTPRRSLIRVLIITGIAFLGGLIAMGWFLVNYGGSLGILAVEQREHEIGVSDIDCEKHLLSFR